MPSLTRALALLPAVFSAVTYAVHPVDVRGSNFVDTVTNQRMQIIGVDYQPGGAAGYKPQDGEDVLSNADVCLRDAAVLQQLGINTIRVYNVDPNLDHSACASIFNSAGIYIILDVNSPLEGESINRNQPWTSYNKDYLSRVFGIVENFKNFPNTLAFFAANEVMNDLNTAMVNPQYIRAVQRDLKDYIKKHSSRPIPVGYSAADVREILRDTYNYLSCDNGDSSASGFFGVNSYSWCGANATIQTAGYADLINMFKDTPIPIFFSEYGCNKVSPRPFTEVAAIYGPQMTAFSGGLVYEYSVEGQVDGNFGLVAIDATDGSVKLQKDFDNVQAQFHKIDMTLATTKSKGALAVAPKCDSKLITTDKFEKNFTLPAICPGCQDLIDNGINNAKNGKLVDIQDLKVKQNIFASAGGQIKGLSLSIVTNNATNVPSNQTLTGGGSGTVGGPGSAQSGSKKSDAGRDYQGQRTTLAWYVGLVAVAFML